MMHIVGLFLAYVGATTIIGLLCLTMVILVDFAGSDPK